MPRNSKESLDSSGLMRRALALKTPLHGVDECNGDVTSIDASARVAHALSRVVASDHTPIGMPRNVRVRADPSGRIFETFDRKLEEVQCLLNYARSANKPIRVASAITTKKVNAPRRLTPMRLLHALTHHRRNNSVHVPKINPEAGSALLPVHLASSPSTSRSSVTPFSPQIYKKKPSRV
jgi:hypothetical protein